MAGRGYNTETITIPSGTTFSTSFEPPVDADIWLRVASLPTNAGLYPQASLDNVTFNRVAEFNTDGTIAGNYTIASGVSAYVKLPNVAKYMRMELDIAEVDGGEFTVIYRRYGAS